jgi:hypothetical protein
MRAIKISMAVIAAIVMGSTPVSSLDVPSLDVSGKAARHDLISCTASDKSMIFLVGAHGASGIALILSSRCDN